MQAAAAASVVAKSWWQAVTYIPTTANRTGATFADGPWTLQREASGSAAVPGWWLSARLATNCNSRASLSRSISYQRPRAQLYSWPGLDDITLGLCWGSAGAHGCTSCLSWHVIAESYPQTCLSGPGGCFFFFLKRHNFSASFSTLHAIALSTLYVSNTCSKHAICAQHDESACWWHKCVACWKTANLKLKLDWMQNLNFGIIVVADVFLMLLSLFWGDTQKWELPFSWPN